jgi:hypothetical protein
MAIEISWLILQCYLCLKLRQVSIYRPQAWWPCVPAVTSIQSGLASSCQESEVRDLAEVQHAERQNVEIQIVDI